MDINSFSFSFSDFINQTLPVTPVAVPEPAGRRIVSCSPSKQSNGASSSATRSRLFAAITRSTPAARFNRVLSDLDLKVSTRRIELIEDFPSFDRNLDGRVDNDLLFAATLRSGFQERSLLLPDANNTYIAAFLQDDWKVHPQFLSIWVCDMRLTPT